MSVTWGKKCIISIQQIERNYILIKGRMNRWNDERMNRRKDDQVKERNNKGGMNICKEGWIYARKDELLNEWLLPKNCDDLTFRYIFIRILEQVKRFLDIHTLPYSSILIHTLPYSSILIHTHPYSSILIPTYPYSSLHIPTHPYSSILIHSHHTHSYSSILIHTHP